MTKSKLDYACRSPEFCTLLVLKKRNKNNSGLTTKWHQEDNESKPFACADPEGGGGGQGVKTP